MQKRDARKGCRKDKDTQEGDAGRLGVNKNNFIIIFILIILLALFLPACKANTGQDGHDGHDNSLEASKEEASKKNYSGFTEKNQKLHINDKTYLINPEGKTVEDRIKVPEGFTRVETARNSFGQYLRNLPLKPHGSKVKYYNGKTKPRDVHEAVLDIDVGDRDLQQCADAVMRLWAEYLYARKEYDKISFHFTNGFLADYATWMEGNRIKVEGNNAYWVKQAQHSNDYASFRKYLDMVFAYAGTLSLSKEMKKVPLVDIRIGDVFLKGDDPGHCVIVLDMAQNDTTGEKIFIIAQSYMPAQDIHILKNPANGEGNPWYSANFKDKLITPEWEFTGDQLYRFEK